jgi:hypothetical protein
MFRRIQQTSPFQERLAAAAVRLRNEARDLPADFEREEILRKARRVETALHIDRWFNSKELQAPT